MNKVVREAVEIWINS